MKIAIVAPSPIPYGPGGAEAVWAGLYHQLLVNSPHDVELIKIPVRESSLPEVMSAYEAFAKLDLSHFDLVISGKYPAWMVDHPRHVVYMLHPLRGLYDSYHYFGRPLTVDSAEPQVRQLAVRAASLRRAGLPGLFELWRTASASLGAEHPDLEFPGALARTLVRAMDRVALDPRSISQYLAISRTVARRPDYFPPGVSVTVVLPPSDLVGLHELPGEYFFTASRHDAPKRLELLLDGMSHYRGASRLLIAGSGPQTSRLTELAARDSRVELVGRVSPEQLVEHYARAIGVPFIPIDEDLGLITYEAMRAGKPVLTALDSGGPTELVRDGVTGLVVEPTAEAIGAGLGALEELGRLPETGDAARHAVRSVSWSAVVRALLHENAARRGRTIVRPGRPRLVVTSTFRLWPPRNGGQQRAYQLYGSLTEWFDVDVVCSAAPGVEPSVREIRPGLVEHVVPRSPAHDFEELASSREAGLPVTDIVAGRLMSLTPEYSSTLRGLLEGAVGLILADPYLYPVAREACGDVPIVYDAYNCEYLLKSQMLPDTPAGRALLEEVRSVEDGASTDSVLVMSVSDEDRLNIHTLYGTPNERFVLAPNGVDLPRVPFTPMSVRRENRERWLASLRARGSGLQLQSLATFVGSWHLPNNEAAQAIVAIAEELPHVGFLLVGSHVGALRRTDVPPNVFLLGEISDAAKITVLSTVDVALAPLMTGSGTNLKVVEYLAAGVPVVSTLVGMRGLNVPRDCVRVADIETFGEAIHRELAEADAAEERTVRARIAVERLYDWAAIARRIAPRLLESLGCVDPDLAEVTAPSR